MLCPRCDASMVVYMKPHTVSRGGRAVTVDGPGYQCTLCMARCCTMDQLRATEAAAAAAWRKAYAEPIPTAREAPPIRRAC